MASKEHIALSNLIKKIHKDLRTESKILGADEAWENHCINRTNLEKYAFAMKTLATKFWENSNEDSRILWTLNTCVTYINEEISKFREKEIEIAEKINVEACQSSWKPNGEKWKLLDVGSCYNPFKQFGCFDVTAVDIAPGAEDVIECDFLKVDVINNMTPFEGNKITGLLQKSFDFIIFSLLLEYLPSPEQRKVCCEKAYELLRSEGLLIIITPDSNHVGHNAKLVKSWQFVLAKMGFSRIKYEKLKHVHCMAFRKALNSKITIRWADLHKDKQFYDNIHIPQDFNTRNSLNDEKINPEIHPINESNFSQELPFNDDP